MRLLDRYLLRELMIPLFITLTSFVLLFLVSDLVSNLGGLLEDQLSIGNIAELYLYRTSNVLSEALVPVGLLLSTMYALAGHARHNELTAIRAAGISLWRLLVPYLMVGCVFSVGLFWLDEYALPDAEQRIQQIESGRFDAGDQVEQFQFHNERDDREWIVEVFDRQAMTLTNVTVQWRRPDDTVQIVQAADAIWRGDRWEFHSGSVRLLDPGNRTNRFALGRDFASTNIVAFDESPEDIWSEYTVSQLTARSAAKRAAVPLTVLADYFALHPELSGPKRALLLTQFHARIATPWTSLVVMMLAIPFSVPSGRRNIFYGVTAGLGVCFGFYLLQRFGLAMGTGGHLPPWLAAWLPNLLFASLAIILISRAR